MAQPLKDVLGSTRVLQRGSCLRVEVLGLLGVGLEGALGLDACAVDELLPFLASLGILVQTVEFGELVVTLASLLLQNDALRNF